MYLANQQVVYLIRRIARRVFLQPTYYLSYVVLTIALHEVLVIGESRTHRETHPQVRAENGLWQYIAMNNRVRDIG
jgi:hypothetical protein